MKKASIKRKGYLTLREQVWQRIRELKRFVYHDLQLNLTEENVRYCLRSWEKSGHLKVNIINSVKHYELVIDTGIEPPRVNRQGQPSTKGLGREQMWRAMRMMGDFDYRQLAALASTDQVTIADNEAHTYIRMLHKAGYLVQTKAPSNAGGLAHYQLKPAAWTGNKPPMIKRTKVVWDANLQQVVYPKELDDGY